jgi:hypothetical protein
MIHDSCSRRLRRLGMGVALCALVPLAVWGQAPAPVAPVAPAAPTFAARNYMVDAGIFIGLAGAAIFAVVRSSKRV